MTFKLKYLKRFLAVRSNLLYHHSKYHISSITDDENTLNRSLSNLKEVIENFLSSKNDYRGFSVTLFRTFVKS